MFRSGVRPGPAQWPGGPSWWAQTPVPRVPKVLECEEGRYHDPPAHALGRHNPCPGRHPPVRFLPTVQTG